MLCGPAPAVISNGTGPEGQGLEDLNLQTAEICNRNPQARDRRRRTYLSRVASPRAAWAAARRAIGTR